MTDMTVPTQAEALAALSILKLGRDVGSKQVALLQTFIAAHPDSEPVTGYRHIHFKPVTTGHRAWEICTEDGTIGEIIQWSEKPPSFTLKFPFETREGAEATARAWLSPPARGNGSSQDHGAANAAAETPPPETEFDYKAEYEKAYREAANLATILWKQYYAKDAPNWGLCATAEGILTQIDNMTTGLVKANTAQTERDKSRDEQQNLSSPDTVTVGRVLTDDEMRAVATRLFDDVPKLLGDHSVRAWTRDDMLNAIVTGYRAALNGGEHG